MISVPYVQDFKFRSVLISVFSRHTSVPNYRTSVRDHEKYLTVYIKRIKKEEEQSKYSNQGVFQCFAM